MKLDALFFVRNGTATTGLIVKSHPDEHSIPLLRPASSQDRTLAGWIDRRGIGEDQMFPAETLFVSTNGEGSHTYAYVSSFEFACNSDVSPLMPKNEMTLQEKLFYAECITLNRFRFSYGRKPKGERLKAIDLPSFPASWAKPLPLTSASSLAWIFNDHPSSTRLRRNRPDMALVPLDTLFTLRKGHGLDLASLDRATRDDGIRFVSRTKRNNGLAAYVRRIDELPPYEGGELTCALNGEGGVLYTFLQDQPFYTAYHVAALSPKVPMSREEMLFYCMCIRANRFRYSFGRQANRTLGSIEVPSKESIPFWIDGTLRRVVANVSEAA